MTGTACAEEQAVPGPDPLRADDPQAALGDSNLNLPDSMAQAFEPAPQGSPCPPASLLVRSRLQGPFPPLSQFLDLLVLRRQFGLLALINGREIASMRCFRGCLAMPGNLGQPGERRVNHELQRPTGLTVGGGTQVTTVPR